MKKILAVVLSVVMLFAVCVPAFAADTADSKKITINDNAPEIVDGKQTGDSRVYTSTDPVDPNFVSYTVTIPAETQIQWGTTKSLFSYSVKTQLDLGKRLAISAVSQSGTQEMKNAGTDKTLPYTFSKTNGGEVIDTLAYTTETEVVDTNRTFNIDIADETWKAAPIAEYEDYLTFTVEIVDAPVAP